MTLKIGVIADDFTGATDIASFLVLNGLKTVQLCGVSEDLPAPDVEAVVISHKSRSCPAEEAIRETRASLDWLVKNGCKQIYFKYCSTFDSTSKGNIGPVTDALMERLGTGFTIFQPALPVNGRTVFKGYLFVGDVLLEESGMKNHPITPMTDSSLLRLVEMQSKGKCGLVSLEVVKKGPQAIRDRIAELEKAGFSYAVLDATDENDLVAQGEALKDMPLVTGGSGLAIGLARAVREADADPEKAQQAGYPAGPKCAVLSGSCSVMTNKQVAFYKERAAAKLVDVASTRKGQRQNSWTWTPCFPKAQTWTPWLASTGTLSSPIRKTPWHLLSTPLPTQRNSPACRKNTAWRHPPGLWKTSLLPLQRALPRMAWNAS